VNYVFRPERCIETCTGLAMKFELRSEIFVVSLRQSTHGVGRPRALVAPRELPGQRGTSQLGTFADVAVDSNVGGVA